MPIHLQRITVDRRSSIKNLHDFEVDFIDDTCEKFLCFQNSSMESQKQENSEKTCFRVPMHFRTNRFTFNKNPPPPKLLHPNLHGPVLHTGAFFSAFS